MDTPDSSTSPLRILAISDVWQGANDYAFVRAFRRAGHSVSVVSAPNYIPQWERTSLKILRRLLTPMLIAEYNQALITAAKKMQPELFFVFKGAYLTPATLVVIKEMGAIAIQFYPDVSFHTHGKYISQALPHYDWVFTTKSYGLDDMLTQLGIGNASFMSHAFDPEVHAPLTGEKKTGHHYGCDVSFIGTWSPKKQNILEHIQRSLPKSKLRVWGNQWQNSGDCLKNMVEGRAITGTEYAKAIHDSAINLAILSEVRDGASSGDQITARTFEIPAAGGFMLHERTEEAMQYFEDGKDLVKKIRYYLDHADEREKIAKAGRQRCLTSKYSVDDRALSVIEKYHQLNVERLASKSQ